MASANANLHKAKGAKNDEFYTQLTDVAKELMHYKAHFKDKIVFCNCDDPTWSAFWKYFHLNFAELGLKKLISTHYDKEKATYKMEYTGGNDNDIDVGVKTPLEGNGDFRNQECLDLLDECDIVVTNPPFSLFREYVAVLMEYQKKFLIIGNQNAITYKDVFPLIRDDKIWLGSQKSCISLFFEVPEDYEVPESAHRVCVNALGEEYCKQHHMTYMRTACWFTNMDIAKRHEKLILWKNYTPEDYPKYDNYDAINVNKTDEIPFDYDGIMGVPITFLYKYSPDQFEILGLLQSSTDEQAGIPNLRYYNDFKEMRQDMSFTGASGGKANGNPVIKEKPLKGNFLYNPITKEYVHSVYARIVIRKKVGV